MDFKQIQELIKMINKSNIGELTIEQKDFRLTIRQKECADKFSNILFHIQVGFDKISNKYNF